MKLRTPVYFATGVACCLYLAAANRYGLSLFDNPAMRSFRSATNSLQHK
jgi:hypothetical protein